MKKTLLKISENQFSKIMESLEEENRSLEEQLVVPQTNTANQTNTPSIFGNIPNQKSSERENFIDSLIKQRGGVRNAQGKIVFPCLKKLESMKVAGTEAQFDVAGTTYTFFDNGKYSREDKTDKTTGTWKCDTQGFVELDGKQKLGRTPFQWKPSPTEEEVRDGKKLLRYGMMGDFVKKIQERLQSEGFKVGPIDSKFGGQTLKAVKEFQTKVGLKKVDGLVGKDTYAAMFRKPTEKTQSLQPKGLQNVTPQKPTSGVQRTANIPKSTTTPNTTVADTGLDFS
jgi:hypothetical protein